MNNTRPQDSHQTVTRRPMVEFLSPLLMERIIEEALEVLEKIGIFVENEEALELLGEAGATVDKGRRRVLIPDELVWRCVRSAPSSVSIFDRDGKPAMKLEGLSVHFDPGSAALKILDSKSGEARAPVTADLISFVRLTDALTNLSAQSTALVPCDVPEAIADRYRLYVALIHSSKPIVTGIFTTEALSVMKDMLAAVAGDEGSVRERPLAIFDACPSPPLKWSRLTAQSLLDCARYGVPAELVSMPLVGATAPATLAGALVQHTAENVSGIVIHQLACPGSPIIYGGSPAILDMRHGTIAMGSVETIILSGAYAQIGRFLGLPTHGYVGLSDAKILDAQAGYESGMGATLAALAGINIVSGAGMLEAENCQSLEKLVIDDEICGMALRLVAGVQPRGEKLAEDLFGDLSQGDLFLTSPITLEWLRKEVGFPSQVVDRLSREMWQNGGRKDIVQRARERVRTLLAQYQPKPLPDLVQQALTRIMSDDARLRGMERLPESRLE